MGFVLIFFDTLLVILAVIRWIVVVWVIISWVLFFAANSSFRRRNRPFLRSLTLPARLQSSIRLMHSSSPSFTRRDCDHLRRRIAPR